MQVVANLLHILDLIHCTSNIRGNVLTSSRWLLKGALASLELLGDHLSIKISGLMKRYLHLYIRLACNRITVSLVQFHNKVHESNLIPTLTIFLTFEIYCCCKSFFQIFTILKPFGYILKAVLCDYQIFAKSSAAVPSGAPLSLIHTSPFIRKGTMQCGVSSILHLL